MDFRFAAASQAARSRADRSLDHPERLLLFDPIRLSVAVLAQGVSSLYDRPEPFLRLAGQWPLGANRLRAGDERPRSRRPRGGADGTRVDLITPAPSFVPVLGPAADVHHDKSDWRKELARPDLGDPGADYGQWGSRGRRSSQALQVRPTVDGLAQPTAKRGDATVLAELDIDTWSCCDASLSTTRSQIGSSGNKRLVLAV